MPLTTIIAALGAATIWAGASLIAHRPAAALGAFEFTRIQLISSSAVLAMLTTLGGLWATVSWDHTAELAVSGIVGVLLCNLAGIACLRRGGPRRAQFLLALDAPITAALGYGFLGEILSAQALLGGALVLSAVMLALLFGREPKEAHALETVQGSLAAVVVLGLTAATCRAIGLIAIKPVILAGTDPMAASALRIAGSAAVLAVVSLWPTKAFEPLTKPDGRLVLEAVAPGILGYVVATTLLLFALRNYNSGLVTVLGSTTPVLVLPLLWIRTGRRPPVTAWIAAILLIAGVSLILGE